MILCLNDSNCVNGGRCVSGICVCTNDYLTDRQHQIRYNALTLPMVGAILHDIPSLRHIYLGIFISLASIGLINNIFALITFIRDRIRFTVSGIYLIIFSICSILIMFLILTNIITAFRYDDYPFRLWACNIYPYIFLVMIHTSILMTTAIAVEGVLNRYFGFDKFRSRKCALFLSFFLFILILLSNLDKIFTRRLISDPSGHLYCTHNYPSYQFWIYINTSNSYIYFIIPCVIHLICIICFLSKMAQQKQSWTRKMFIYRDILFPSFLIIICLFPYVIFRHLLDSCMILSNQFYFRFHIGFILLLSIPQISTFVIYILPNKYYLKEFQQTWIYRLLCCFKKQRQIQEFEVIHKLWQRRSSLETVMTISSLNDGFINSELYNKIRLEV